MTPTAGDNYFLLSNHDNGSDDQMTSDLSDGDPTPVNSPCQDEGHSEGLYHQVNEALSLWIFIHCLSMCFDISSEGKIYLYFFLTWCVYGFGIKIIEVKEEKKGEVRGV